MMFPLTSSSNVLTTHSKQLIFLGIIAITSVVHCESVQLSQGSTDIASLESQNPWASFAGILFILYAVALQSKVQILWSESRMLRKLHKINPTFLISNITGVDTNTRFAQIFEKLAKGRNRRINCIYPHLYVLFTILVDVVFFLDLSLPVLHISEAFNSFRLLIYIGSFTVLGARPLSCPELLSLTFIILVQASFIVLFGLGIAHIPKGVRVTLDVIRIIDLVVITITSIIKISRAYHSTDDDISQVVNTILKKSVRGDSRQGRRLNFMRQLVEPDEYEHENRSGKIMSYWRPDTFALIDIASVLLYAFTNGLVVGELAHGAIPVFVVMESLEVVSSFLFFINETQVEPTLFVKLLGIAKHGDDTTYHD